MLVDTHQLLCVPFAVQEAKPKSEINLSNFFVLLKKKKEGDLKVY